jgi:hypothetical protein
MFWRRLLIIAAIGVALTFAVSLCLRTETQAEVLQGSPESDAPDDWVSQAFDPYLLGDADQAESCYPFVWQHTQRETLRALLQLPAQAPSGSDALALARYAQYAEAHQDENLFREGLRREPHNALYHYLLAELYVKQGLTGKGPHTDKQTGAFRYDYTITDRPKLDEGMRELALGLQLPYASHRGTLLRTQLDAMPPTRNYEDRLNQITVLTAAQFPEYATLNYLARVNGFYLSRLLAEGQRAAAAPFLHTGERLVVQLANGTPPTLRGQMETLNIGTLCEKNDARVCRAFGLSGEATMIEAHQELLVGKLRAWLEHGRKEHLAETDTLLREHAGVMPSILLPVYGTQPAGLITRESLRPSRLVEYVMAERTVATVLSLFAFLLLGYAGLKYARWRLATRGAQAPAPGIDLTLADWRRILCYGLLAPLALYLLYIALPALSGREHGMQHATIPFCIGVGVFSLWTLLVPTTMAAGILRRRSIAAGLLTVRRPWCARFTRLAIALLSIVWCVLAWGLLLRPLSWAMLTPLLVHAPFSTGAQVGLTCLLGVLLLAAPFIPAIWERKHAGAAPLHLAMARAMITTYAVMTLFYAALVPVCVACERHYVYIDQIVRPMRQGDDISFTLVEGQLTLMLRNEVRQGATALGIGWQ